MEPPLNLAADLPHSPPAPDMVAIYCLCDPRFETPVESVRYIGRTVDPAARLARHLHKYSSNRGTYRNRWVEKLGRLGLEPTLRVLTWVSEQDWRQAERDSIGYARASGCRLTNGTDGGDGIPGMRLAPHVIAAQRAWERSPEHLAALIAGRKAQAATRRATHAAPIPCACDCGARIAPRDKDGVPRRFVRNHNRRTLDRTPVPCACGCDEMIIPYDKKGTRRHYVYGHQGRRPCSDQKRVAISQSLQGHAVSEETRARISASLRA